MMSLPIIWLILAAVLLAVEIITPGGVIMIFFSLGALATSGIVWRYEGLGFAWQLLIFGGLSLLSLSTLRPILLKRLGARRTAYSVFDLTGKLATVTEPIEPPLSGRVVLNGSTWNAVASESIDVGRTVRVIKHDNLTLTVQPEE